MGILILGIVAVAGIPKKEAVIFTVTDQNRVQVHCTFESEPEQILEEAGIGLGVDDTFSVSRQFGILDIRVIRPQPEKQIFQQEQYYTQVLPPETVHCFTPDLPEGKETILREGRTGEAESRALVTYRGGEEVSRVLLEQKVRIQPVSRIVAVGIGTPRQKEAAEPVIGNGLITLPTGEVLTYDKVITSLATAYCDKGLTATGTQARVGAIAVDPEVIPYGTRMFIVSVDGEYIYGLATAEDCGSKEHIYDTRIDLHFDTYAECRKFGARYCRVYILT